MTRPRRFRWLRFAPLLAILVLGIVWGRKALTPPLDVTRFPDGTRVTVHRIDWGSSSYVDGAPWQQVSAPVLPAKIVRKVSPLSENTAVLWLSAKGPSARLPQVLSVFDGQGSELELTQVSGGLTEPYALRLDAYPRRSQWLGLRFRTLDRQIIGEVRLTNPRVSRAPQWTPEQLPALRQIGDLKIRLLDFRTGLPTNIAGGFEHQRRTEIQLDVRSSDSWEPFTILATDATGNDFGYTSQGRQRSGSRYLFPYGKSLFPHEQAYRLRVGLIRTAGARFEPKELFVLRNIPLPAPRTETKLPLTQRQGSLAPHLSSLSRLLRPERPTLRILAEGPAHKPHVSLVRVVDQEGRELRLAEGGHSLSFYTSVSGEKLPRSRSWHDLPFYLRNGVKSVTVTLAIQRPKWVEFTAAPTWPAKKGSSTAAK